MTDKSLVMLLTAPEAWFKLLFAFLRLCYSLYHLWCSIFSDQKQGELMWTFWLLLGKFFYDRSCTYLWHAKCTVLQWWTQNGSLQVLDSEDVILTYIVWVHSAHWPGHSLTCTAIKVPISLLFSYSSVWSNLASKTLSILQHWSLPVSAYEPHSYIGSRKC